MDPILPLNIIKRKKPGIPPPRRRRRSRLVPIPVPQAPLQVVQEESEPTDSASSTYSFNLFRSTPSPRSSVDSKRSVRTDETSPAPSLKELPPDDNKTTDDNTQTTLPKMPCGTSFLHMESSTPLSTSPVPPSSPPRPSRPPRNPLRQQRKPVPTAPLPPTPSNQHQHPLHSHPLLPPLKVAPSPLPTIIIQTPPLRILRPHQSEPQLSTPDRSRPATAPHNHTTFPSSTGEYDRSRNTSTSSLGSTKTTSNVALTPFEKQAPAARPGAAVLSPSRGTQDPKPIFVYAFLSDSIILSLLFARDLQKDVPKKAASLMSGYELSVLEGGRSNYPLLIPSSSTSTTPIEGYLISNLSPAERKKLQDFPFHPHWRRSSSPQTPTPLFDMVDVDVDDGKGNTVQATTIAWRKDVAQVTGLKLVPRAWDVEKGRKACVAAYLSVYCSPEKSAERLKLKKRSQRKITHVKDDFVPALRNVRSIV